MGGSYAEEAFGKASEEAEPRFQEVVTLYSIHSKACGHDQCVVTAGRKLLRNGGCVSPKTEHAKSQQSWAFHVTLQLEEGPAVAGRGGAAPEKDPDGWSASTSSRWP